MIPLKFETVESDRLFYDQWQFCIRFHLSEISVLRGLPDHDKILKILQEREHWRRQVRQRWPGLNMTLGDDTISEKDVQAVLDFAEFLHSRTQPFKIVISVSRAWIYTNSQDLVEQVARFPHVRYVKLTQTMITRPRDCVVVLQPQHSFRSYLRSRRFEEGEKQRLASFLQNQQHIRVAPALQAWLDVHWNRSQDYFFIDHNGEGFELMLSLVVPNLIRKTLPIVAKY